MTPLDRFRFWAGWLLCAAMLAACKGPSPDETMRALEASGYTDIKITGESDGCPKGDSFTGATFTAISPTGVRMSGLLCRSRFAAAYTVRIFLGEPQ